MGGSRVGGQRGGGTGGPDPPPPPSSRIARLSIFAMLKFSVRPLLGIWTTLEKIFWICAWSSLSRLEPEEVVVLGLNWMFQMSGFLTLGRAFLFFGTNNGLRVRSRWVGIHIAGNNRSLCVHNRLRVRSSTKLTLLTVATGSSALCHASP